MCHLKWVAPFSKKIRKTKKDHDEGERYDGWLTDSIQIMKAEMDIIQQKQILIDSYKMADDKEEEGREQAALEEEVARMRATIEEVAARTQANNMVMDEVAATRTQANNMVMDEVNSSMGLANNMMINQEMD